MLSSPRPRRLEVGVWRQNRPEECGRRERPRVEEVLPQRVRGVNLARERIATSGRDPYGVGTRLRHPAGSRELCGDWTQFSAFADSRVRHTCSMSEIESGNEKKAAKLSFSVCVFALTDSKFPGIFLLLWGSHPREKSLGEKWDVGVSLPHCWCF